MLTKVAVVVSNTRLLEDCMLAVISALAGGLELGRKQTRNKKADERDEKQGRLLERDEVDGIQRLLGTWTRYTPSTNNRGLLMVYT